jgi:hypothetical protein
MRARGEEDFAIPIPYRRTTMRRLIHAPQESTGRPATENRSSAAMKEKKHPRADILREGA